MLKISMIHDMTNQCITIQFLGDTQRHVIGEKKCHRETIVEKYQIHKRNKSLTYTTCFSLIMIRRRVKNYRFNVKQRSSIRVERSKGHIHNHQRSETYSFQEK